VRGTHADLSDGAFDVAMVAFLSAYALQNRQDHAALVEAIGNGAIESAPGW
jgi:hypothetical protein